MSATKRWHETRSQRSNDFGSRNPFDRNGLARLPQNALKPGRENKTLATVCAPIKAVILQIS